MDSNNFLYQQRVVVLGKFTSVIFFVFDLHVLISWVIFIELFLT